MTLDYLPPQAYTKETLLKAYNWLQSQSDQVREIANTPDQLVSLYLKAARHGNEAVDRPSIQSFKSELKSLAGMMGDLEKDKRQPPPPMPQMTYQAPTPQMQTPVPPPAYQQQAPITPPPAPQVATPVAPKYDEMTENLIREVKNELNLSSDIEALRMLVKIGYQKVRSLYK